MHIPRKLKATSLLSTAHPPLAGDQVVKSLPRDNGAVPRDPHVIPSPFHLGQIQ